jgi:hypothetical protein
MPDINVGGDLSAAAIGFIAPVMNGLEYWNFFGDAATTARNLVTGKPQGAVVGAPVLGAGFATFLHNSNFVQTGLVDQTEVTLLAVSRVPNKTNTQFKYVIGNFASPSTKEGGSNLLYNSPANGGIGTYASRNNAGTNVATSAYIGTTRDHSLWSFNVGRIGAGIQRAEDKTSGEVANAPTTYPRQAPAVGAYRIGSSISTSFSNLTTVDVAWAAIYSRVLTDAEIDAIYLKVKLYLATKGITV